MKRCVSGSCGLPQELPSGKSLNRKRGTPAHSTMSLAAPMTTVGMPFRSRYRATRLTVWWQTGQVGTSSAASTWSCRQRARISGASVSSVTRWLRLVGAPWKRLAQREAALARELAHQRQREPGAASPWPWCACGRSRCGEMRVSWSTRGVAGIDRVELGGGVVERARPLVALVGLVGRRRGDQRQRAVLQRLLQRRERRVDVVRPAIGIVVAQREVIVARAPHVVDRRVVLGREIGGVGHGRESAAGGRRSQFRLESDNFAGSP